MESIEAMNDQFVRRSPRKDVHSYSVIDEIYRQEDPRKLEDVCGPEPYPSNKALIKTESPSIKVIN